MRRKVILIKGYASIAKSITKAEFERINADHICIIVALRRPQFLPPGFILNLNTIESRISELLDYWRSQEMDHFVSSEYAQTAIEHGGKDVRVVEGNSLQTSWFFETIKTFHRNFGQLIVECEVIQGRGQRIKIEERYFTFPEAIDYLGTSTID